MPKFGHFWPKSIYFPIFTKFPTCSILNVLFQIYDLFFKISSLNTQIWAFHICPISMVMISNLTFDNFKFSKLLSPNAQIWVFWAKRYQLFNLNEIWSAAYLEAADFKSDISFQKFWDFITFLIKINYFVSWFYLLN